MVIHCFYVLCCMRYGGVRSYEMVSHLWRNLILLRLSVGYLFRLRAKLEATPLRVSEENIKLLKSTSPRHASSNHSTALDLSAPRVKLTQRQSPSAEYRHRNTAAIKIQASLLGWYQFDSKKNSIYFIVFPTEVIYLLKVFGPLRPTLQLYSCVLYSFMPSC